MPLASPRQRFTTSLNRILASLGPDGEWDASATRHLVAFVTEFKFSLGFDSRVYSCLDSIPKSTVRSLLVCLKKAQLPIVSELMGLLSIVLRSELVRLHSEDTDCVLVVVQVMCAFPSDVTTQEMGCKALINLSLSSNVERAVHFEAACAAVSRAMAAFPHVDTLQELACKSLKNISLFPCCKDCIIDLEAVTLVLRALQIHRGNVRVQQHGLAALRNMTCQDNANRALIASHGGLGTIVQAMKAHPDDATVQEQGCAAIWMLGFVDDFLRPGLETDSLLAVLDALHAHMQNAQVVQMGCGALCALAGSRSVAAGMEQRVVRAVLLAMRTHLDNSGVQQQACSAFCNFALTPSLNLCIVDEGGIVCIVEAMTAHVEDPLVQECGCWALCNLTGHAEHSMEIGARGGVRVVVEAMRAHPSDTRVQRRGCITLSALSLSDSSSSLIWELGGMVAVQQSMLLHPLDQDVQEEGCSAIRNLSITGWRQELPGQDLVGVVLAAIEGHRRLAAVQEQGCAALRALVFKNKTNSRRVAFSKGLDSLLHTMVLYRESKFVQEQCCAIIRSLVLHLCSEAELEPPPDLTRAIQCLVEAMQAQPTEACIQEIACETLWSWVHATSGDVAAFLQQCSAIEAVLSAMLAHKSAPEVQEKACLAVQAMAKQGVLLCNSIARAGAVECVLGAMAALRTVESVQRAGCLALQDMCVSPEVKAHILRMGTREMMFDIMQNHPLNSRLQKVVARTLCLLWA